MDKYCVALNNILYIDKGLTTEEQYVIINLDTFKPKLDFCCLTDNGEYALYFCKKSNTYYAVSRFQHDNVQKEWHLKQALHFINLDNKLYNLHMNYYNMMKG